MRQDLKDIIDTCSDVDFRELQHSINLAAQVKDFCRENKMSVEALADKLSMSVTETTSFYNGTHQYDLRSIAKFEVLVHETLAKLKDEVIKVRYDKPVKKDTE